MSDGLLLGSMRDETQYFVEVLCIMIGTKYMLFLAHSSTTRRSSSSSRRVILKSKVPYLARKVSE